MLQHLLDQIRSRLDPKGLPYRSLRALRHPRETFKASRHRLTKNSIFREESDLPYCSLLPKPLLDAVMTHLHPRSVLDVGCGTGRALDFFLEHGVEAQGIEGSPLGISRAKNPGRILQWDLNRELNLNRQFDLVWCFEVAEHIHPDFVDPFLRTLTNHSSLLVMSAAHPGQGGTGHFNEQPRAYWLDQLGRQGYRHNDDLKVLLCKDWTWYPENIFVFESTPRPV